MVRISTFNIRFKTPAFDKFQLIDLERNLELLHVQRVHSKDLHDAFVNYDTRITDSKGTHFYKIPEGPLLLLILKSRHKGQIVTTLRKWTPQKEDFYKLRVGDMFKVVIG